MFNLNYSPEEYQNNKPFPHINFSEKEGEKALLLSDHQSKLLS